jgi:hypothetical protein
MYCTKCGAEVDAEDAFCGKCGAQVKGAQTPGTPEATTVMPAAPDATQPMPAVTPEPAASAVPSPPAQASGAPAQAVPAGASPGRRRTVLVVAGILAALAVLVAAGFGAAMLLAPHDRSTTTSAATGNAGTLGFDTDSPTAADQKTQTETAGTSTDATTGSSPEATSAPSGEPAVTQPASGVEFPPPPVAGVSKAQAIDTVGTFLNYVKEDQPRKARAMVTSHFLTFVGGESWFTPTSGTFMQFEVVSAVKSKGSWAVHVDEQWNSGPEKTTYTVIEKGGKPMIDKIQWAQM